MWPFLNQLKTPEYRLALEITGVILWALLTVTLLASIGANIIDQKRLVQLFEMREQTLLRRPDIVATVKELAQEKLDYRFGERKFLPGNIRNNVIVLYQNGQISALGPLENTSFQASLFANIPPRTPTKIDMGDEDYFVYVVPAGARKIVLYESEDLINGPRNTIILSLILGILLFSVLLFVAAINIARKVIRPIEGLAERERAYARHIAHELKTPLTIVKSDLELLLADPEESKERIVDSIDEIRTMCTTVDDLLLLGAGEMGLQKEPTNMKTCIAEAIDKHGKNGSIRWKIEGEGTQETEADTRLLRTLLKNIIANIQTHATPDTLATIRFEEEKIIFENEAKKVKSEVLEKAFDPFVGTPGKGSGIGLSLVKRIVDLHGWKINMEQEDGKTVRIVIDTAQ